MCAAGTSRSTGWAVTADGAAAGHGPAHVWAADAERALRLAARRCLPGVRLDASSVIVLGPHDGAPDSASAEAHRSPAAAVTLDATHDARPRRACFEGLTP